MVETTQPVILGSNSLDIVYYIYLERVCPLCLALTPPEQGFSKQNKGHLGSRYIYLYIYIYTYIYSILYLLWGICIHRPQMAQDF